MDQDNDVGNGLAPADHAERADDTWPDARALPCKPIFYENFSGHPADSQDEGAPKFPQPNDRERITIYGEKGGVWWPITTLDLVKLNATGFQGHYMLAYQGQRSQLSVMPIECGTSTPHDDCPEQRTGMTTGGKPGWRCNREKTVMVFFMTEQSNGCSITDDDPLQP